MGDQKRSKHTIGTQLQHTVYARHTRDILISFSSQRHTHNSETHPNIAQNLLKHYFGFMIFEKVYIYNFRSANNALENL